jgi:hypothetical protein
MLKMHGPCAQDIHVQSTLPVKSKQALVDGACGQRAQALAKDPAMTGFRTILESSPNILL